MPSLALILSIQPYITRFDLHSDGRTTFYEVSLMINIHAAARDGDTVTVRTLLSAAGALSLINTQDASGATPLYCAAAYGMLLSRSS